MRSGFLGNDSMAVGVVQEMLIHDRPITQTEFENSYNYILNLPETPV
jgi:hypothetical protein